MNIEAGKTYGNTDGKLAKVSFPKDEGSTVYKYLRDGKPFGALIRTSDAKFAAKFPITVEG